jgi:hypothetical protein
MNSDSTHVVLRHLLEVAPNGEIDLGGGFGVRRFQQGDGKAWADVEFDPVVKEAWGVPTGERSDWIKKVDQGILAGNYRSDAAVCDASNAIIGRISVDTCHVEYEGRAGQLPVTEIQIFLQRTGTGLGTRIIEEISRLASSCPDKVVYHLAARIHPSNPRPASLLTRFGFERALIVDGEYEWWLWPKYDSGA